MLNTPPAQGHAHKQNATAQSEYGAAVLEAFK